MNSIQIFTEKQILLLQSFVENPTPTTLANVQIFIEEQSSEIQGQQKTASRVSIPLFPEHQPFLAYAEKVNSREIGQCRYMRIDQCREIIEGINPSLVSFREFLSRCRQFANVEEYRCYYQDFPVGHIGICAHRVYVNVPFYVKSDDFYSSVVDRFHFLNEIEAKYAYGNTLQLANNINTLAD
jgi:hypothetical protein